MEMERGQDQKPLFFSPSFLGRSMKEISSDFLQVEAENVVSRWFRGHSNVDFFLWSDSGGNIIKQQLVFMDQVIEWNVAEGLKTGALIEDASEIESAGVDRSETVCFDQVAQKQFIEIAQELVGAIKALQSDEKDRIIENFAKVTPTSMGNDIMRSLMRPQVKRKKTSFTAKLRKFFKKWTR